MGHYGIIVLCYGTLYMLMHHEFNLGKFQYYVHKIISSIKYWWYNFMSSKKTNQQIMLETKLNDLGAEVYREFPSINSGGCCVFAAAVANELKHHGIPVSGIVSAWDADEGSHNINDVRKKIPTNTVRHWNARGIQFYHVGIEFTIGKIKYHYDTTGVKKASNTLDDMPIYNGRLELYELRALAGKKKGWNSNFNRRCIPQLRALIKQRLANDIDAINS